MGSKVAYVIILFSTEIEKARLQAEAEAAEDARKQAEAKAAAEAKRRRELEREAARQALLKASIPLGFLTFYKFRQKDFLYQKHFDISAD